MGRSLYKWANLLGPTVLVIILGIVLWQGRIVRKKAVLAQYYQEKKTDEE